VIAPDWPGYGESEGFERPYAVEDLVEWLVSLLDFLQIERADVVGISMGGGATLGIALAHPDRVRRIVPVDAYGLQDRLAAQRTSWLVTLMPWITRLTYHFMRNNRSLTRRFMQTLFADPARIDEEVVQDVLDVLKQPGCERPFALFQAREVGWQRLHTCYMDRLGEITAPTLYIHGRKDTLVPPQFAEAAARCTPGAALQLLDSGHWPMREIPEQFNRVISAFLEL
jgi:pimeloyl-ACP methyl ester carboxylesterase